MPTWPCWLLAGSGLAPVSHWKTVLLPDPAKPAMPTFIYLVGQWVVRSSLDGRQSADNPLYNAQPYGLRTTDSDYGLRTRTTD